MKIGFIDYYLDEWHANNYPRMLKEASGGKMEVAYAWAKIDSPLPGGRTTEKWCSDMGIELVRDMREIIEKSDALVVLSPDNCEMHEELCALPLAGGKRTYVDKTFAPDADTARRIFAVAEAAGTPCYSTSALRFSSEYKDITPGGVTAISSWGPGSFETYSIHQLEPIVMLMQKKPLRVMAAGQPGQAEFLTIEFEGGAIATMTQYAHGSPFAMNVCTPSGNRTVTVESDYFAAFIRALVRFFDTGEILVPHEDTVQIMHLRAAGLQAWQTPGEWIEV